MIAPFVNQSLPLDIIKDAPPAAAYALRKLKSGYKGAPIRVRDDTITESDIPFCGQDLCTGTLLSWLSRNQVASIPLGTDGNANGLSDGWTRIGGITGFDLTCANGYQTFTLNSTNSGGGVDVDGIVKDITCVAGNILVFSLTGNIVQSGTTTRLRLSFRDGSNATVGSDVTANITSATDANITVTTLAAGATTVKCRAIIETVSIGNGDSCTLNIKDASVTISNQSAYVVTAYDQSGNANHATQTTAANQPRIVNAGVLDVDASGKPCIQAILASDTHFVVADANSLDFTTNASFSIVHNPNSVGETSGRILDKNTGALINLTGTSNLSLQGAGSVNMFTYGSSVINTITADSNANQTKSYKNGTLAGTDVRPLLVSNSDSMFILNRVDLARQYDGKLSELILFSTTLTDAQRQKLEKNQSKYYSIGVA